MATRIARWFKRRYGAGRGDVFILRTEAGWQVIGRMGGAGWPEVIHYFDSEEEAGAMVRRMSGDLAPAVPEAHVAARADGITEPGVEASPEPESVVGGVVPR